MAFPTHSKYSISSCVKKFFPGLRKKRERDYNDITRWSTEQLKQLRDLYPKSSKEKLLKIFSFSTWMGIKAAAFRYKIKRIRTPGDNRHLKHDENLFTSWTEKSAYILGYLEADGCAVYPPVGGCMVRFACSNKDKSYLLKLREVIGSNSTVGTCRALLKGKEYFSSNFSVISRKWRPFLESHLRIDKIPEMPEEMLHHYIRGYFDGDGSIFFQNQSKNYRSNIVFGSLKFAEEFASLLRPVVESKLTIYKKTNSEFCWYINLSKNPTIRLGHYIYNCSNYSLDRKKCLFSKALGI
jgi:hypothetical protein